MKYFFILGKNHLLSIVEIIKLLEYQKGNFTVSDLSSKVLILDIEGDFSPQFFLARLGGTVKVGKIVKAQLNIDELVKVIQAKPGGKMNFGFSVYAKEENVQPRRLENLRWKMGDLGLKIKKELQQSGRSVRWVVSREKNLSSVVVKTNKLIETGAEVVLLVGQREVLLGQTLAVQEFEEYSGRDYGREYRDARSGMIPPKLAKIMINLAGAPMPGTILDPFCGSGTVLQEALLMGYQHVMGSDLSEKAVHDTEKNLEWLMIKYQMTNGKRQVSDKSKILISKSQIISKSKILNPKPELRPSLDGTINYKPQPTNPNIQIHQLDVKSLSNKFAKESVDAIVTEPYLGPSNLKYARIKHASELGAIKKELLELYLGAFREFRKVLKPGGRVVMVWPVWQLGIKYWQKEIDLNNLVYLPLINQVIDLGFRKINVLAKEVSQKYNIKLNERNSLLYSRPNQTVLREIWVWEKK